jgi:hypothetical protein
MYLYVVGGRSCVQKLMRIWGGGGTELRSIPGNQYMLFVSRDSQNLINTFCNAPQKKMSQSSYELLPVNSQYLEDFFLTLILSCKLRNPAEHYEQKFLLHFLQPNLYQDCCIF